MSVGVSVAVGVSVGVGVGVCRIGNSGRCDVVMVNIRQRES